MENVGLLLNDMGALVLGHTEKVVLNTIFATVFTTKTALGNCRLTGRDWKKEDFPLVRLPRQTTYTNPRASMRCIHAYSVVAEVIAEQLSIINERPWKMREVPEDWKEATPVFRKGKKEDQGNYRPISLTSIPGKVVEKLILQACGCKQCHLQAYGRKECYWEQPAWIDQGELLLGSLHHCHDCLDR